jgi:hypothetical protein
MGIDAWVPAGNPENLSKAIWINWSYNKILHFFYDFFNFIKALHMLVPYIAYENTIQKASFLRENQEGGNPWKYLKSI